MADYTPHQKKIIQRYYDHKDEILLNRLQEIVTELYLADSATKQKNLWGRAAKAMTGLRVPESIQAHILAEKRPDLLAKHVAQWLREASAAKGGKK